MIESTFWSTEVILCPISVSEGSLLVTNTILVHPQWSHTRSGVGKSSQSSVSCLKTDREHSFLNYHKGHHHRWKEVAIKRDLENGIRTKKTFALRQRVPVDGYRVLFRLRIPNIDWNTTKSVSEVCSRNTQILMSTFQFKRQQWPEFDWFRRFLSGRNCFTIFLNFTRYWRQNTVTRAKNSSRSYLC